jgi:hypothetical protein
MPIISPLVMKKVAVGGVARYTWGSAAIDGATEKLKGGRIPDRRRRSVSFLSQ